MFGLGQKVVSVGMDDYALPLDGIHGLLIVRVKLLVENFEPIQPKSKLQTLMRQ